MDIQDLLEMIIRNIEIEAPAEEWWFYTDRLLPRIFRSNVLPFKTQIKRQSNNTTLI